ncbi:YjbF family lipoprotein [Shigella boydii]
MNNLAADPLLKPHKSLMAQAATRTMGSTEYQQVRYATARSVFKWDGTDTVEVGGDETPGRVLDKESPPTRRAGVTAIRRQQRQVPSRNGNRRG